MMFSRLIGLEIADLIGKQKGCHMNAKMLNYKVSCTDCKDLCCQKKLALFILLSKGLLICFLCVCVCIHLQIEMIKLKFGT